VVDRLITDVAWSVRRAEPIVRRRTYTGTEGAERRRATAGEGGPPEDGRQGLMDRGAAEEGRQALMDPASRSDRVSHWLLQNGQLHSATSTS